MWHIALASISSISDMDDALHKICDIKQTRSTSSVFLCFGLLVFVERVMLQSAANWVQKG